MGKALRKIGKFYSSMIMGNIGIFIFIGLLSVVFQDQGWLPNQDIYAISQLVYEIVLPICIGYLGGERIGGRAGGILAVLMTAGCLTSDSAVGILVGMLAAPVGGYVWKYGGEPLKKRAKSSIQMLTGNLLMGLWGCLLAIAGYYILSPFLEMVSIGLAGCVKVLMERNMLGALSIIVEPAKVLFLNNIVNHGILVPLGMEQLKELGSSALFLVESNPGPGLGMLAALYWLYREKRELYAASMVAQSAGGLHEVYFPEVLGNLWLLFPLIAAGAAGNFWFQISGCGLKAPVSPGSVITILLMAGKQNMAKAALGILLSAGISFIGTVIVLKIQTIRVENKSFEKENFVEESSEKDAFEKETSAGESLIKELSAGESFEKELSAGEPVEKETSAGESVEKETSVGESVEKEISVGESAIKETSVQENPIPEFMDMIEKSTDRKEETNMPIHTIGFVCDAGVGSSVMGAALFRRKLAQNHICGVQVEAYACDQIPGQLDLIVCQKDFLRLLADIPKETEIFAVDSFMGGEAFEELMQMIGRRNG